MNLLSKKKLFSLSLALSVSLFSPFSYPAFAAVSVTDEAVQDKEKQNSDNPVSFSERIQKIIDDYYKEQEAQEKAEQAKYNSPPNSVQSGHGNNEITSVNQVEVYNNPPPVERPLIQEGRYNFDWQGTPIASSIYAVAKIAKRDIVVNGELNGKVYISLHDVTCNEALDYLSRAFNFNWEVDENTNAILVSTEKKMLQSRTFKIRHAMDMTKVKDEMVSLGIEQSKVYANTESRTVSVTGTPHNLKQAERRLAEIDKPVSQCLILAQLIEMNHGKDLDLGIQYSLPTYSHTGTTSGKTNSDSFHGNWLEKLTFSASSAANKALSKGNVISRPMIMIMNGQEGNVFFGDNVPILSSTATTSSTNITVTYQQVGTKLVITPAINEESGEIAMKINTEVSNIAQWMTNGGTRAPQIASRTATTSAHLRSGQSFVIGGLMSASELDNLSGIPGLMDLPILGKLFRYHSKSKEYAEIYIMITPYLVTDEIDPKEILRKAGK